MRDLVAPQVLVQSTPAGPVPPPCLWLTPLLGYWGVSHREACCPVGASLFWYFIVFIFQWHLHGEREGHGTYIYMGVSSLFTSSCGATLSFEPERLRYEYYEGFGEHTRFSPDIGGPNLQNVYHVHQAAQLQYPYKVN
jgi:hypothetical protein